MKIVILGVTGMLGNAMFRVLSEDAQLDVYGAVRNPESKRFFAPELAAKFITLLNVESDAALEELFTKEKPDVVINCVGLVKQLADAKEPLLAVPMNTLLPHKLAALCKDFGARLVHISTDCVFSGKKGQYVESDFADADDLYGRSKYLGEVDYPHAITLRTSIIGHELSGNRSLVNWFLSQEGPVKGFTKAVFSGLPTVELSRVVRDYVLKQPELHGLYHVAAEPINKFDLLTLVARVYDKQIEINADDAFVIDRSLNAARFHEATGYEPPAWPELIKRMHAFH